MPLPVNSYGYQSCSIILEGENIIVQNNEDGTSDVFYIINGQYTPIELGELCCNMYMNRLSVDGTPLGDDPIIGSQGQTYSWDYNDSVCRWKKKVDCNNLPPFNVVLNPQGNFGALFEVQPEETCFIDLTFDFLVKFDCSDLLSVENSIDTLTLETLYQDLSGYTQQLTELINQGAPTGVFNTIIVDMGYTSPPVLGSLTGYCVTEIGATVYEALVNNNFTGGDELWQQYLTTGILPLSNAYNLEPETAQDVVNQFIALNISYNGTLATVCDNFGDLINETESWLTNLSAYNASVLALEDLIETTNTQINQIISTNNCLYSTNAIENLNLSLAIDIQTPQESIVDTIYSETIFNIGQGNLFNYLNSNVDNTGIYIPNYEGVGCNSSDCDLLARKIIPRLVTQAKESQLITGTTFTTTMNELIGFIGNDYFNSGWVRYNTLITDQSIISGLTGNNINLSIQVVSSCVNFSILIDRVQLKKVCDKKVRNEIFISDNIGFDLTKTIDNKKSWVANETEVNRYHSLDFRTTDYSEKHEKLVINTKEVDLNLSIAMGVETDVWCYINDNPCILSACTTASTMTPCCCNTDPIVSGTSVTGGTILLPPISAYTCNYVVGQLGPGGGIIFWVDPNNPCVALEVTANNIDEMEWNPWSQQYVGGTYTAFGYGQSNTQQIISAIQPNNAAYVTYTYTQNGYSDWYLPSIDELKYLYDIITGLSGETAMQGVFWSSSEYNTNYAYYLWNGIIYTTQYPEINKNVIKGVRGIRKINTSNCSSLYDVITGATSSNFSVESNSCYDVYKINQLTGTSAFTGYWLVNMPDGTLGVFNQTTIPSIASSTIDHSYTITKECCESYAEALTIVEQNLDLGDHLFKPYWNEDCKRCSVRRCEDIHCLDFNSLTDTSFSGFTTVDNFNDFINGELINVRCRKISSHYPTLRALYERYANSTDYCSVESAAFNYYNMIEFSDLIGTYWIDLFEQMIPSTTIWSSAYVLSNTVFDSQKFKYKSGSVFICEPNSSLPVPFSNSGNTDVDYYIYDNELICQNHNYCNDIYYYNGDCGSEFIGSVIIETSNPIESSGGVITNE